MDTKMMFFEINSQDKNKETYSNISSNSIISFRENSNGYNTDVYVKKLDWVTLSISYSKFKELLVLHK